MIVWFFFCLLLLMFYAGLMIFYFFGWKKISSSTATSFSGNTHVSVIIVARNEEENVARCLNSVLQQNYPSRFFEVILVDDDSEDATFEIANKFSNPNLKVLKLSENFDTKKRSFKKQAIALGISKASGELIVTTDADCVMQKNWLSSLVSYYEKYSPVMIAAPVAFQNENNFLERWQSLDLCGMMAITAGAIKNNFPNMCNGANLAYTKKAFYEVGGFSGIDRQPSGDDVMLMMKMSKKFPGGIQFLKSKEAVVFTKPVSHFNELLQQRMRWLSKGMEFPDARVSAVLASSWLFNLSIIINFAGGFFFKEMMIVATILFFSKTVFEFPLLYSGCAFFEKRKLLWLILPAQLIHILYVTFVGAFSRFGKFKWKGRNY